MQKLIVAFVLLVATALAGCSSMPNPTAQPSPSPTGSADLPQHVTSPMQLLANTGVFASWFRSYGMTGNPGPANTTIFGNDKGAVPFQVEGVMYHNTQTGTTNHMLLAFAMTFLNDGDAASYLSNWSFCKSHLEGRYVLHHGKVLTMIVTDLSDGKPDSVVAPQAVAAKNDVMARTGATDACAA